MSQVQLTKQEIQGKAYLYKHRSDFQKHANREYCAAYKQGILDDVCQHMTQKQKWTDEKIRHTADRFPTAQEFLTEEPSAYQAAYRRGLLESLFPTHERRLWTRAKVFKAAARCGDLKIFRSEYPDAYVIAQDMGFLEKIAEDMRKAKADYFNSTTR